MNRSGPSTCHGTYFLLPFLVWILFRKKRRRGILSFAISPSFDFHFQGRPKTGSQNHFPNPTHEKGNRTLPETLIFISFRFLVNPTLPETLIYTFGSRINRSNGSNRRSLREIHRFPLRTPIFPYLIHRLIRIPSNSLEPSFFIGISDPRYFLLNLFSFSFSRLYLFCFFLNVWLFLMPILDFLQRTLYSVSNDRETLDF